MLKQVEELLVLQDRDRKIRTMQRELDLAPEERKALEARLAGASAEADAVKQRAREIEMERKKLEIEAQAKRDAISRFKTQQFQTRKNEEFQALANEIKRFEKDIEEIEDRELDLMEEAETLKPRIREADQAAAKTKEQVAVQFADLDAKKTAIEEQLVSLRTERRTLAEAVDEHLLERYERLFATKGEAVVAVDHEVCMGCHMKITTQTAVRARAERELVSCDQCGRILYFGE